MHSSATIAKLAPALTKAAAALTNPIASETAKVQAKSGASYSYAYAPLSDLATNVRATLADCDLVMLQEATSTNDGRVGVTTRIVHTSGEWVEMGPLYMPAAGGAQDHGSALTYARRYALLAALLLAAEDDDGAKAQASAPRVGGVRAPANPPRGAPVKEVETESAEGVGLSPVAKTPRPPSPNVAPEAQAGEPPSPPTSGARNVESQDPKVLGKTPEGPGAPDPFLTGDGPHGHKFKGDPDGACLICGWFLDAHSAKAKA